MKELKIEVPKGYEIDKKNSTFECIKFKKKKQIDIKTWDDLCEASAISDDNILNGYYISEYSDILLHEPYDKCEMYNRNVFLTEKEAKSARAAAMISQLMPYYGGAITEKEWESRHKSKYVIYRAGNQIIKDFNKSQYHFLAFRTRENRDEFLKNNLHLIMEYLML